MKKLIVSLMDSLPNHFNNGILESPEKKEPLNVASMARIEATDCLIVEINTSKRLDEIERKLADDIPLTDRELLELGIV